jgi:tetratricopeptide (TPR) repeat protein
MAQEYFEEGLRLKQQLGDLLGIAISQYDLGHLYHTLGNLQVAESLFKEALDTIKGLGEKRHQANVEWYYALLQIDRGNLHAARSLLKDIVFIEELLQRDERVQRANAKLAEVEGAAMAIQKTQGTRAIQSSSTENYADLATKVTPILMAYVSMEAEEFARKFSSAAYENTRTLLSTLQERWSKDKEAADNLARFTEKPERYKPVVEDILQEKLAEDQHLTTALSRLLHEVESIS